MKPFIFKHFAANGRTITACGLRIEPNTDKNEKQHSDGRSSWTRPSGEPTCLKCKKALASQEIRDVVRCSEDGSDTALDRARAAHAKALKLCTMLGPKWKPRIWCNLGWHHEAHVGDLLVHGNGESFTAYFARIAVSGTSPRGCVQALVTQLQVNIAEQVDYLKHAVKSLVLG
ncbi:MAG: hypothetical protein WC986_15010 [Elusimicrobiota bacterium]